MSSERPFAEIDNDRLLYASSYRLVKFLGKSMLGFRVSGTENIPIHGAGIIAANHRHWLDIFLAPTAIPDRHLTMVAKKEVYETPIMGHLFRKWGAISVDRENPGTETTREVIQALKDERLVGVLPEGHRYQETELGELHRGVARWARLGDAITVPTAIRGVDSLPDALRHRSAEVLFGPAIDPPTSKDDENEFMTHLRQSIQDLYNS